jgi:circadian clock protein KaiC
MEKDIEPYLYYPEFMRRKKKLSGARLKTGVLGLDPLVQGGLQTGDFIVLVGGIGTGKTIFACEYVYNGILKSGEPAVFATFEEDVNSVKRNMLQFGMDLESLEREGTLKILDMETLQGKGIAANIDMLMSALDKIKAKRLVVDSLTGLMRGTREKFEYGFLMHLIYKSLKRDGVTTLMTVSSPTDGEMGGLEEFVADGVFQLESYITEEMEMRTRFIIRKLRGTDHSRKYHSVAFTPKGVEILPYT